MTFGKLKIGEHFCYENEEDAIVQYLNETDLTVKNMIFNNVLYPALTKMIESIIRRYKLFAPDEDFDQNFNDTISYLLTKINNFKPIITGYDLLENIDNIKEPFVQISEEDLKAKIVSIFPEIANKDIPEEYLKDMLNTYHIGAVRYNPATAEQVYDQNRQGTDHCCSGMQPCRRWSFA